MMSQLDLDSVNALYATGLWLLNQERTEDALNVFRAIMICAPTDERGWLGLGSCHEKLRHHGAALALYDAGCRAAAPSLRCKIAKARAARLMGEEELSADLYTAAIDLANDLGDDELRNLAIEESRPS